MTQSIQIGSTSYFNIRAAIKAATTGQTIDIGTGLYDIRSSATTFSAIPDPLKLANPNTFARFGAKTLTFTGQGQGSDSSIDTIITGNARIYTHQSDKGNGIPAGINFNNLRFSYGEAFGSYTSPKGSGYILQVGVKSYLSGALNKITSRIPTISLDGVTFAGAHSGAVGTAGGAPFGNYMDVAVSTSLTFNKLNVSLTGQGGGSYFSSNPGTYGSAFLLANGPQITVTNSKFDEGGYRNSLALWGDPKFATNVTISGNTFTRTSNQIIRTAGETLSSVSGSVTGNTFEQGAYLDLQKTAAKILGITGSNTFTLLQGGFGVVVRSNQTAADLANVTISGNTFTGGLAVKSELTAANSVLAFGANKVNGVDYDALLVGGAAADTITGTSAKEWIFGGGDNDLITAGGNDAIVFADTASVDTVSGYSTSANTIQLDDAVFSNLSLLTQADNGSNLDLFYNGTKFAVLAGLGGGGNAVVGTSQIVQF